MNMNKLNLLYAVTTFFFLVSCSPQKKSETKQTTQDMPIFQSKYVELNGIKIHYQEVGQGEPILFLHGGFGTGELQFEEQFMAFGKDYHIISPDTRGHGQSTFDSTPFNYELFAQDAYLFLEELELDSVHLIGFSDGGITGLILAATHPEKVKNLIVIGANTKPDTSAFPQEAINWVKDMSTEEMAENLKLAMPHYWEPEKLPDFVERMKKLWLEEPNLTDEDLYKIQCPTLLVLGENDDIKVTHQEYIKKQIRQSKLIILKNAGHEVHEEKSEEVNRLIEDFVAD
jgi:pimeloyl-ACP methyl ester carboxylesterase